MSIALFDSGQRWGSVRKALAVRQAAYDQQRAARNEGLTMLQTAWIQFQDAVGSVAVSAKYFEASAERAKIGGAQYSSGLLSFDNWIIIEDDFAGAERQYVEAQAAAMTAEAEWIHAKGGSLENEEK
jgi:outer membrane protein TolC